MPSGTPEDRTAELPEAVLDEATRILQEIAGLCHDHRAALAAHDTETLNALGERAETLGARFKLLESARRRVSASGSPISEEVAAARARLVRAAAEAALAAQSCADLLARSSAAAAALRRVLEGFVSAGYLPNGELRPPSRAALLETKA